MGENNKLVENVSLDNFMRMVKMVVDSVFYTDEVTGLVSYMPENYHYTLRLAIGMYYFGYELDDDVEFNYKHVMRYDLNNLKSTIPQIAELIDAIDNEIEFKKQQLLYREIFSPIVNEFQPLLLNIAKVVNEVDVNKITEQINSITPSDIVKAYKQEVIDKE